MLEAVANAASALGLERTRVLVAVSGGIDSSCLLDVLCELRGKLDLEIAVGHVNHGLRGPASEGDAAFVRELASERGCRFHCAEANPTGLRENTSSRERPTVQEAARSTRYEALNRLCDEAAAQRIATAHNANDQAETVLLRLVRGSGPDGLGGIPECSSDGRVVRPLLSVTRKQIEAWAAERGLVWREDASNANTTYARNRLRHEVLPQLERSFNRRVLRTLANFAETTRRDAEWIGSIVEAEAATRFQTIEAADGVSVVIQGAGWDGVPDALARRLVVRLLCDLGIGREASRAHLERVIDFLRRGENTPAGRAIELPCGVRLMRKRSSFEAFRVPIRVPVPGAPGEGAC